MGDFISFWRWLLFKDKDGDYGISNVINLWLIVHTAIAACVGYFTSVSVIDLATKVAIPGAAILVGLSFAWAGRSASLFQDKSFSSFILQHGAPIEGYLYSFQLAILTVLIFLGTNFLIVAGGIGLSSGHIQVDTVLNRFFIVFTGSVAMRECWGAIYFVNKLTIQYYRVREHEINTDG